MKKIYNCVIIGAGDIGALSKNELDHNQSQFILTHAHAIRKNPRLQLNGIVDIIPEKSASAAKKWNTKNFKSIEEIQWNENIDIITIASPSNTHKDIIIKILNTVKNNFLPKILFIENPCCIDKQEAIYIKNFCEQYNIKTIINIPHRFCGRLIQIINNILTGELGNIETIYSTYIKNSNNSEINLANKLELFDFKNLLNFNNMNIYPTKIKYLQITTDKNVIEFTNNFNNFSIISEFEAEKKIYQTEIQYYLINAYDNIAWFLDGKKENLLCDISDAIKNWEIV